MANQYKAEILILYVIDKIPDDIEAEIKSFLGEESWEGMKKKQEENTRSILIGKKKQFQMIEDAIEKFAEDTGTNAYKDNLAKGRIIIKEGNVVEEIINQAKNGESDLIVIGYESRSMIAETMVSGSTRKILRRSGKPVLLVPLAD